MAEKTIIETLVTVFKVQTEGIKESTGEVRKEVAATNKSLGNLQDMGKKAGKEVSGLARNVKQLSSALQLAATTMGLFKVLNNNIGIGNLSERTGQDVKGIQALQRQFEKMGYSAQEANQSIDNFSNSIAAAIYRGEGEGLQLPAMFGISVFDSLGKMRDAVDVMLEIGDAARKMTGSEEAAIMMLQQYGLTAAQAHFAAREASREEYQQEKERARLDAPRIERMREINRLYADQRAALSDLSTEILVQLAPTLKVAGEGLRDLTGYLTQNDAAVSTALKGWVAWKAFGINPVLGAIVAAGLALDRFNNLIKESVSEGGAFGTYLQNLILTDPESGASVADVLPPASKANSTSPGSGRSQSGTGSIGSAPIAEGSAPIAEGRAAIENNPQITKRQKSDGLNTGGSLQSTAQSTGVLNERETALSEVVHRAESNIGGSNSGYNAYNQRTAKDKYAARVGNLEGMTIGEVMAAQRRGEMFATGRYQVIPKTLAEAVKALKLNLSDKYDATTQDRIFKYLANKRAGDFVNGRSNDSRSAQYSLSQEWAGIANPRTGKSYYDGIGGNSANISTAQFNEILASSGSFGGTSQPQSGLIDSARDGSTTNNVNQTTTINVGSITIPGGGTAEENANAFAKWGDQTARAYQFNSGAAS